MAAPPPLTFRSAMTPPLNYQRVRAL